MNDTTAAPAADSTLNTDAPAPTLAAAPPPVPPNSDTSVPPPPDTTKPTGPTFAATWRADIAGGDEKAAKLLERYATPQDFTKAHLDAVKKISSGELAKPLAKDATPEQAAEWRKGNGIPEKPTGYWEGQLPGGLVIGEDDKPLFDAVAEVLHANNVRPEAAHGIAKWYYDMQDQQIQAQQAADAQAKPALEAKLRETWGADFQANANVYSNFLASAPKEVNEVLTQARDAEGNFILYRPEVVSWLVNQAREINPAGHIVPGAGDNSITSIANEIKSIEDLMRSNRPEYNRDAAKQERYRQLIDARTKLEQRGRVA